MPVKFRRLLITLIVSISVFAIPGIAQAADPPPPKPWTFVSTASSNPNGFNLHVEFRAPTTTGGTNYLVETRLYRGNPTSGGLKVAMFSSAPYIALGGSYAADYPLTSPLLSPGTYYVKQVVSVAHLSDDPYKRSRVLDSTDPKQIFVVR